MKKSLSSLLRLFVLSVLVGMAVSPVFAGNYGRTSVPEINVVNNSKGVAISWEKQQNIDKYSIYRRQGLSPAVKIADVSATKNVLYIDKNAVSGTKYQYYAVAYYKGRRGAKTQTESILYLNAPKLQRVENICGGISLEWSSVAGAKEYRVYRFNGTKVACISKTDASSECKYTDANVKNYEKYTYFVVAVNGKFKSACKYSSSDKYMTAPKLKSAANANGYISVSWEPVSGAEKYLVYKKTESTKWALMKTVGNNVFSIKDTDVKNGGQYSYTVQAVKGDAVSGKDENGVVKEYVNVPGNIKLANSNDCITVKWDSVSGACAYRVYRKEGNAANWEQIAQTTNAGYNDKDINDGISYRYTVKAIGKKGGVSGHLSGKKLVALKSLTLRIYSMPDRVLLNWSPSAGATGYRIYRKNPGAKSWTFLGAVTGGAMSYYEDTGVKDGKSYIYTIRQVNGSQMGSYNATGFSFKFAKAPLLTAVLSPKGVRLQWTKASQGTGYIIDRYISENNSWSVVATINKITTLTFDHTGAEYGKDNYYRIRVKDADMLTNIETIFAIDPSKPVVALTYDDGPHPTVTHDILDVLEKYDAKATFFVVGSRVNEYKDCIIREAELGCEIGNHTYNHTILTSVGKSTMVNQVEKTNDAVEKLTGIRPVIVRPPGGSANSSVKSAGEYPLVNWSVDTLDWKNRNSTSVTASVKRNVRDGSIILMHDLYGSTASATREIVPYLIDEGYQLVTVTQLMQLKGIYMEPGKIYYSGY